MASDKVVGSDTKMGVIVRAMSLESANKFRQDIAEHLVLNSHRLTAYDEIRKEV